MPFCLAKTDKTFAYLAKAVNKEDFNEWDTVYRVSRDGCLHYTNTLS